MPAGWEALFRATAACGIWGTACLVVILALAIIVMGTSAEVFSSVVMLMLVMTILILVVAVVVVPRPKDEPSHSPEDDSPREKDSTQ